MDTTSNKIFELYKKDSSNNLGVLWSGIVSQTTYTISYKTIEDPPLIRLFNFLIKLLNKIKKRVER